jgi:hypothetical protein
VRDLLTTLLDAIGLLAVAAGVGAGAARWVGWFGLAVAGVIVLGGSLLAHARARPESGDR